MSLLSRHLEQISLSSESIATLPFPPPKVFTNALLSTTDITSLIRDTEPHERALFSVPPPQPPPSSFNPNPDTKSRRQTVFNVASGEVTTAAGPSRVPRKNTAVAAVLGPELHHEVRKTEGKGEVDIEVLLRGVEKLNAVYETKGVPERVQAIRSRYGRLKDSVDFYEGKVQRLGSELEDINRGDRWEEYEDEERDPAEEEVIEVTDEDLRKEEEEIRELERKKKELEERVSGMERDLGGLLR